MTGLVFVGVAVLTAWWIGEHLIDRKLSSCGWRCLRWLRACGFTRPSAAFQGITESLASRASRVFVGLGWIATNILVGVALSPTGFPVLFFNATQPCLTKVVRRLVEQRIIPTCLAQSLGVGLGRIASSLLGIFIRDAVAPTKIAPARCVCQVTVALVLGGITGWQTGGLAVTKIHTDVVVGAVVVVGARCGGFDASLLKEAKLSLGASLAAVVGVGDALALVAFTGLSIPTVCVGETGDTLTGGCTLGLRAGAVVVCFAALDFSLALVGFTGLPVPAICVGAATPFTVSCCRAERFGLFGAVSVRDTEVVVGFFDAAMAATHLCCLAITWQQTFPLTFSIAGAESLGLVCTVFVGLAFRAEPFLARLSLTGLSIAAVRVLQADHATLVGSIADQCLSATVIVGQACCVFGFLALAVQTCLTLRAIVGDGAGL